jgi:hypothetical protein
LKKYWNLLNQNENIIKALHNQRVNLTAKKRRKLPLVLAALNSKQHIHIERSKNRTFQKKEYL